MSWNLRIYLDPPHNGNHVFAPGDRVSGKVLFDPKEDENVDSIRIDFKGKYMTSVRSGEGPGEERRPYEIDMFWLHKTLFQGPFKMRASTYEYRFSFQFPERFRYNPIDFHDEGPFPIGTRDGSQPLPPSCEDNGSHFYANYRIYYHLTARIPRTFGDWESGIFLRFTPHRTELSPAPHLKTMKFGEKLHRRYRLTDEGIPRPLTSGETFKETFHHHAINHSVRCSFSAVVPTAIVIGRPYPIEVTLLSTDAETGHSIPGFQFTSYYLILKSTTVIWVPGFLVDANNTLEEEITLSRGSANCPLPINKPVEINGMFPSNPPYLPPSFRSCAVQRTYGLELKATVSCLGEDTTFKVHWPLVTLYPATMEDGIEDAIRSIESGAGDLGLEDQTGLPVYEGYDGTS